LLLYIKDHGEALLDKYPICTVVSCEREVSDDNDLGSSKEHGFGLWGDPMQHARDICGEEDSSRSCETVIVVKQ
jgi:hypothetical protein